MDIVSCRKKHFEGEKRRVEMPVRCQHLTGETPIDFGDSLEAL